MASASAIVFLDVVGAALAFGNGVFRFFKAPTAGSVVFIRAVILQNLVLFASVILAGTGRFIPVGSAGFQPPTAIAVVRIVFAVLPVGIGDAGVAGVFAEERVILAGADQILVDVSIVRPIVIGVFAVPFTGHFGIVTLRSGSRRRDVVRVVAVRPTGLVGIFERQTVNGIAFAVHLGPPPLVVGFFAS